MALFDAKDSRSKEAASLMAKTRPVVIGVEALVETLGVLKHKAGPAASRTVLEDLIRLDNVEWAGETDVAGAYRLQEEEKALSFVDAAVVQLAVRRAMPLMTYDKAQEAAWKRRRPA